MLSMPQVIEQSLFLFKKNREKGEFGATLLQHSRRASPQEPVRVRPQERLYFEFVAIAQGRRKKRFKIAGSPYTEFFNYHLQKLDESGALDRMHRRYSHKPVSGTPKPKM